MGDQKKTQNRIRKKINELVQQRIKETGCDEETARKAVRDESKAKKKLRKTKPDDEIKQLEKETRKQFAGAGEKKIEKAVRAAVAKYYSQRKKQKKNSIKNSGNKLIMQKIADKWCPRSESWFDEKCEQTYNSLYLLAAMLGENLEKSTEMTEKLYPQECSKYFDLLAKKRFNSKEPAKPKMLAPDYLAEIDQKVEAQKPKAPAPTKKRKTKLERALNAKLANNTENKSETELLKEAMKEMQMKNGREQVKLLRKNWFPVNQAWFDQQCKDYAAKINASADDLGYDLKNNPADFKKLKEKSSELTKEYFKLLETKKLNHDRVAEKENKALNKNKKKKKTKPAAEGVENAAEEEARENKKIKFDDDDDDDAVDAGDLVEDIAMEEESQDEEKENSPKKKKKNKKKKKAPSSTPATPEFIPLESPGSAKKKTSSEKKKKDKKNNDKPAENIEGSAKKSKSKKKL